MTLKYLRQKNQGLQEDSNKSSENEPNQSISKDDDIFEKTSEIAKNRAERRSKLIKKRKSN